MSLAPLNSLDASPSVGRFGAVGNGGAASNGRRMPNNLPALESSPSGNLLPMGVRSPPPANNNGRGLPAVLPTLKKKKKKKKKKRDSEGGGGGGGGNGFDSSVDLDSSLDASMDGSSMGGGGPLLDQLDSSIRERHNKVTSPPPLQQRPPPPEKPAIVPMPMHHMGFMNADVGASSALGEISMSGGSVFRQGGSRQPQLVPKKSGAAKKSVRAVEAAQYMNRDREDSASAPPERKQERKSRKEDRASDVYAQLKDMGYRGSKIKETYYQEGWMYYYCKSDRDVGLNTMLVCSKCADELFMVSREDKQELYDHLLKHKRLKVRCACGHKCHMGPEMREHVASCEVTRKMILKKHSKSIAKAVAIAQKMADQL